MREQMPEFTGNPQDESKLKKTLAGVMAAGMVAGTADVAESRKPNTPDNFKPDQTMAETGASEAIAEQNRIEASHGIKIQMPATEDKEDGGRDLAKDFSLGQGAGESTKNSPQIKNARILSADSQNYLDNEGSIYKAVAFRQMIAKFGEKRFTDLLEILKSIYPKGEGKQMEEVLKSYSFSLPQLKDISDIDRKEQLNKKLYAIVDLLEEGQAEKLAELFRKLRQEGYDRAYDFSWDPAKIEAMLNDHEERRALIDYTNKVGLQASTLKRESGLSDDRFRDLSYVERMKIFEALKAEGKVHDAQP